jgi:adenylate cyclase
MGTEIERKFLVHDRSVLDGAEGVAYRQGYLSTDPERTVRIRRAGAHAFVTIKGLMRGTTRAEFEYAIPLEDVNALLDLCLRPVIEKTRYRIDHAGLTWEVDVFEGDNDGLVVAEVELPWADTAVAIPAWVGAEVTADARYQNANLVRHPFRDWDRTRA